MRCTPQACPLVDDTSARGAAIVRPVEEPAVGDALGADPPRPVREQFRLAPLVPVERRVRVQLRAAPLVAKCAHASL